MSHLVVHGADGALFQFGGENTLLPTQNDERADVARLLADALAFLAGATPRSSPDATEGARDQHSTESSRCPADRRTGDVVLLSERRAVVPGPSTTE